jgi:hypothetical protein
MLVESIVLVVQVDPMAIVLVEVYQNVVLKGNVTLFDENDKNDEAVILLILILILTI